jgi:hypothetical protein
LPPSALRPTQIGPDPKWEAFRDALDQQGIFPTPSAFTCIFGEMDLYSRSLNSPKETPQEGDDFLVVINLYSTLTRVWVPHLPNLLAFLQEVDAKPVPWKDPLKEEPWQKVFYDKEVQGLIEGVKNAFQKLSNGEIEVTVKSLRQSTDGERKQSDI